MTSTEWETQWKRLDPYRVPADVKRADVSAEWFAQLRHYHVDAVDHGITQLIGSVKDTFLPGLGLLRELIQARIGKYDRQPGTCDRCHGSKWVDAWPWWSNGMVYTGMERCPDCGVPPPQYKPPENRRPLTKAEYIAWQAGTLEQLPMPVSGGKRVKKSEHGMATFQPPDVPKEPEPV
jgi:hypothetical protein